MLHDVPRGPFERRSKVVLESAFTHTVKPSRINETSSSCPDRIFSSGNGSSKGSGKGLKLLRVNKIAHALWTRQWCLAFFPKGRSTLSFQVGALGPPTACHEDFGADEVSKSCSCLTVPSLFSAFHSIEESETQGTVFVEFSPRSRMDPSSTSAILQDKLSGTCGRLESKTVSIDKPIPSQRTRGRKDVQMPTREDTEKHRACACLVATQRLPNLEVSRNHSQRDRVETLGSATSCKLSWCDGVTV